MMKTKRKAPLTHKEMNRISGGGFFDLYWIPLAGPNLKESARAADLEEQSKKLEEEIPKRRPALDSSQKIMNMPKLHVLGGNYHVHK